ncbi:MAG: TrkH family potassium uptake protein [Paracoccaceae bacterium]|nr:TrkH family potassium uptake protein [Paracoccaceae bacterium]
MIDPRPVGYIIGRLLLLLGLLMLIPGFLDWALANGNAQGFMVSALFTIGIGGVVVLSTSNAVGHGLSTRLAFLLTALIWLVLPLFAALPFMLAAPQMHFTDAYFEAVSGITTTGSTVIVGLEGYPEGMNLWRGMLNWLGGLGIAFIAMIFLPVMRVGGMQFFRAEGFDTLGKILPRAADIARSLLGAYAGLTLAAGLVYGALGMTALDASVHAMATIATGGFSPSDASFGKYPGAAEYAGALFMVLGALPFIRFVQLMRGDVGPIWRDAQVRAILLWIATAVSGVVVWRLATSGGPVEPVLRDALFNIVSIFTGTGFFSGSFGNWGGFALVVAFIVGLIGGCSGSSSGGLSVFRVQVCVAAVRSQIRRVASPNRIEPVRYGGRTVDTETLSALMMYVTSYVLLIGVLSVGMTLVGVDTQSALFGVWTSLGNIGYGFGPMVAPTGTFIDFPLAAKWILILTMLLGRLSLLALLVLLLPRFWRQ